MNPSTTHLPRWVASAEGVEDRRRMFAIVRRTGKPHLFVSGGRWWSMGDGGDIAHIVLRAARTLHADAAAPKGH